MAHSSSPQQSFATRETLEEAAKQSLIPSEVGPQMSVAPTGTGRSRTFDAGDLPRSTPAPTQTIAPIQSFPKPTGASGPTQQQRFQASQQVQRDTAIIQRRQQLSEEATRRGKGFTRLEGERFLRPAGGIRRLRRATAREQIRFRRKEPTIQQTLRRETVTTRELPPTEIFQEGFSTTVAAPEAVSMASREAQQETSRIGIGGFVRGVGREVKTSDTYSEFFTGVKEQFSTSFPKTVEKVKTVGGKVKEKGKGIFKRQIFELNLAKDIAKAGIQKGRETPLPSPFRGTIIPKREVFETPEGKKLTQRIELLTLASFITPRAIGKQIIVETIPLRQRMKPLGVEEIQTTVVKGKPIRTPDYKIFTEKQPPRIRKTTTLTKEQLGKQPEIVFLPKVTSRATTPFKAIVDKPFIVLEAKTARVGTASEIAGTSKRLNILEFKKLPPTQQLLVRRLARSKAGGRPVSDEFLFKVLKPDQLRFISNIEITKLAKVRPT